MTTSAPHTATFLGWPDRWYQGGLYDDCGLPVHLYPVGVTADGKGPCGENDPEYHHDECWCRFDGCTGEYDDLGFPCSARCGICSICPPGYPCLFDCKVCWP